MIKRALLFLFLVSATPVFAQEPIVTVELAEPEVVVGQPGALTITVLVPTWMPQPPVFPNFEVPSLMVRLPEGATTSTSERIEGETWAGLRRTYRLYPLAAGLFVLPAQSIALTYADPGTRQPVTVEVPTPEIRLTSVVPEAAQGLDPLIIATSFRLEQSIEGDETLVAGDAIVREVRAEITGTTPILIPELIPMVEGDVLRPYPAEPRVDEVEDRATLSGTRTERTTYVAQMDGDVVLPQISLDWFNLETGSVETVNLPQMAFTVAGSASAPEENVLSLRKIILIFAIGTFGVLALRALWPRASQWWAALRARWFASEAFAHRQVTKAIAARDLGATYDAIDIWQSRCQLTVDTASTIANALLSIGEGRFGKAGSSEDWATLRQTYRRARRRGLVKRLNGSSQGLPPLNP